MHYYTIPGEPDAVVWQDDDGNSGVIRRHDTEAWANYEAWCAAGHTPPVIGAGGPATLDVAQADAYAAVNHAADIAMAPILSPYSQAEVTTWPEQVAEANAWRADPDADTPLIDVVLGQSDDKAALVATILSKSATYIEQSGQVIAWRRAMGEWIAAQTDVQAFVGFNPRYPDLPA